MFQLIEVDPIFSADNLLKIGAGFRSARSISFSKSFNLGSKNQFIYP
jgi:hypothetical protein